jgi:hypothetical protein
MKLFFKITGTILLILSLSLLISYIIKPQKTRRFVRDVLGLTCLDFKQAEYSKKLSDKLPQYIQYSIASGIKKCSNEDELLLQLDKGKLVKVKSSKYFIVEELSHSYPYLTEKSQELLIEIGKRFREKISETRLKGSRFRVTSITRTTEKLENLKGVNSNASMNSPHLYGNAFDLSYIRFSSRKWFMTNCDEKYLMEALAEVIWQLRKEKKCWATFERQQNCYHVVSR